MSTRAQRFWLTWIILVEALGAFFTGVYFFVWGQDFTSPPWVFLMDVVPGGEKLWGSLLLVSAAFFLTGLQWQRVWFRIVGCFVVGITYIAVGFFLCVVPLYQENSLNGSVIIWFIVGVITILLAGLMASDDPPSLSRTKK